MGGSARACDPRCRAAARRPEGALSCAASVPLPGVLNRSCAWDHQHLLSHRRMAVGLEARPGSASGACLAIGDMSFGRLSRGLRTSQHRGPEVPASPHEQPQRHIKTTTVSARRSRGAPPNAREAVAGRFPGLAREAHGRFNLVASRMAGRWRIVEMELWDRDAIDSSGPPSSSSMLKVPAASASSPSRASSTAGTARAGTTRRWSSPGTATTKAIMPPGAVGPSWRPMAHYAATSSSTLVTTRAFGQSGARRPRGPPDGGHPQDSRVPRRGWWVTG